MINTETKLRSALKELIDSNKKVSTRAVEKFAGKGNGLISKNYPELLQEIEIAKATQTKSKNNLLTTDAEKLRKIRKKLKDEQLSHSETKSDYEKSKRDILLLTTQVAELTAQLHKLKSDEKSVGENNINRLFMDKI